MEISTLFVVRVWRQTQRGGLAFRASVRAVDVEQERMFTRAADLARYLERASVEFAEPGPSARPPIPPQRSPA
jgi:hypothetical protein